MDHAALYSFMTRARYGVVSSLVANGTPQPAFVGIAITPDLEIVFDTLVKRRKYPDLSSRPACSLVLWWNSEQTVQIDGVAFEPTGPALERYREAYFVASSDGRDRLSWAGITYLVVQPRWIRAGDYHRSPPMIEETLFSR